MLVEFNTDSESELLNVARVVSRSGSSEICDYSRKRCFELVLVLFWRGVTRPWGSKFAFRTWMYVRKWTETLQLRGLVGVSVRYGGRTDASASLTRRIRGTDTCCQSWQNERNLARTHGASVLSFCSVLRPSKICSCTIPPLIQRCKRVIRTTWNVHARDIL